MSDQAQQHAAPSERGQTANKKAKLSLLQAADKKLENWTKFFIGDDDPPTFLAGEQEAAQDPSAPAASAVAPVKDNALPVEAATQQASPVAAATTAAKASKPSIFQRADQNLDKWTKFLIGEEPAPAAAAEGADGLQGQGTPTENPAEAATDTGTVVLGVEPAPTGPAIGDLGVPPASAGTAASAASEVATDSAATASYGTSALRLGLRVLDRSPVDDAPKPADAAIGVAERVSGTGFYTPPASVSEPAAQNPDELLNPAVQPPLQPRLVTGGGQGPGVGAPLAANGGSRAVAAGSARPGDGLVEEQLHLLEQLLERHVNAETTINALHNNVRKQLASQSHTIEQELLDIKASLEITLKSGVKRINDRQEMFENTYAPQLGLLQQVLEAQQQYHADSNARFAELSAQSQQMRDSLDTLRNRIDQYQQTLTEAFTVAGSKQTQGGRWFGK